MSEETDRLFSKGLAAGFAGGTVMSGVNRAGFELNQAIWNLMVAYITMNGLQTEQEQVKKLLKLET
jgi:hypothetical protein